MCKPIANESFVGPDWSDPDFDYDSFSWEGSIIPGRLRTFYPKIFFEDFLKFSRFSENLRDFFDGSEVTSVQPLTPGVSKILYTWGIVCPKNGPNTFLTITNASNKILTYKFRKMYRENDDLFLNGENCKGWPEFRREGGNFLCFNSGIDGKICSY